MAQRTASLVSNFYMKLLNQYGLFVSLLSYLTDIIRTLGRFLKNYLADDILFGNTFDRPLKLPWGTSAALRFMQ